MVKRNLAKVETAGPSPVVRSIFTSDLISPRFFHVVKQANKRLDQVRRRVQWATCGRRRRKTDPLYTIRKRLLTGEEKLAPPAVQRIHDALQLGDPSGETMLAWRVKEAIRDLYQQVDEHAARKHVTEIITICAKRSSPPELQSLARTITQWQEEILAYINHHYSNGITEGMNNHIKKNQTKRLRIPQLQQLPTPHPTRLRRSTHQHPHNHTHPITTTKSEEPLNVLRGKHVRSYREAGHGGQLFLRESSHISCMEITFNNYLT